MIVPALALSVAMASTSEPCCPPESCRYMPKRVRWLLSIIEEIKRDGENPAEALAFYMQDGATTDRRSRSLGPARRWATDIVADLAMAQSAGCRDPVSIARHLCPFAVIDEAKAAARAVDQEAEDAVP